MRLPGDSQNPQIPVLQHTQIFRMVCFKIQPFFFKSTYFREHALEVSQEKVLFSNIQTYQHTHMFRKSLPLAFCGDVQYWGLPPPPRMVRAKKRSEKEFTF